MTGKTMAYPVSCYTVNLKEELLEKQQPIRACKNYHGLGNLLTYLESTSSLIQVYAG